MGSNIVDKLKSLAVDISTVNLDPVNPRKHNTANIEILKRSLSKYGQRKPIVVQKKGMICRAGNGLLEAAKALEWDKIAAVIINEESVDAVGFSIMDNKSAETSEWNQENLASALSSLKAADFNLDYSGFEQEELDEILNSLTPEDSGEEDEVSEVVEESVIEKGQLWILGNHRLLCGDSTKKEDVAKLMDEQKADMVFTDPPYGVAYGNKNDFLNSWDEGNRNQTPIRADELKEADICKLWRRSFELTRDILKETNSYYIFGPQIQGMMMMMMMMEAGLPYRHVIIWVKNNHVLGRSDYNYKHEPIFFGWTTNHKFYGKGEFQTSVWEVDKPYKSDMHPTMKPVRLIVNGLYNSSKAKDICYDPFCGSGSTLIACEQTNRICYAIEIEPVYCEVTIKRWQNYTGQEATEAETGKTLEDFKK